MSNVCGTVSSNIYERLAAISRPLAAANFVCLPSPVRNHFFFPPFVQTFRLQFWGSDDEVKANMYIFSLKISFKINLTDRWPVIKTKTGVDSAKTETFWNVIKNKVKDALATTAKLYNFNSVTAEDEATSYNSVCIRWGGVSLLYKYLCCCYIMHSGLNVNIAFEG